MQKYLITGGAGFIGSNFIHYLLEKYSACQIVNLDLLTYAGNLENLADIKADSRYHFVQGDINDQELVERLIKTYGCEILVNFAAESHVDRSITGPDVFFQTNTQGTLSLLKAAKNQNIQKFLQISTDEVYGSLGQQGYFSENSPLEPSSPYSASKAAADMFVLAYAKTFGLNANITRSSNNYGPYQHPEKLIPLMITKGMQGKKLPIYGTGENIRDWLYVKDNCRAFDTVIHKGQPGEIYNVGAHSEHSNNEIVHLIVDQLGLSTDRIEYVADRLGHDQRYALDNSKIKMELGWQPQAGFQTCLTQTINWYLNHEPWWRKDKFENS
ncbi:dTDP-glucose 4,6-dehydratase [Ligilactobacillus pobuzihii]|uniref:dTDP-glucose 4,6-dehydratase n=1 Tax=Ligilactobacillus pobuzihii TaxID=449659 RepID=A0A0R2LPG8_9LACO|nr:dTDP-glucose 4,6-dehydratase [Ligilactobacillus pobuzihii]KRK09334.1 hypothetical protein FD11_GL001022 [Ligilactobacillus pobuzihii E100301 = KCTC 13174]KRO01346.1 hypothetical protein IV66_GL000419 [Ligilactobacillus pobuzihii]GEN49080.1 dTDP-glucose 4,6-dehydratase [Ligilactobacillus pobuzihii]